ncbi:MAG: elongation factor P [Fibrobacter sp.]|nr:elongation factor P [Fibrobacter sp.]
MATVSTNEFRKKLKIMIDGQPYMIVENQFVKPGKGQAFNRVRVKNLLTGRTIDRTFRSGETVEEAEVNTTDMTYLYNDGTNYHFMDKQSMETVEIGLDTMFGAEKWLLDGCDVEVTWYDGKPIEVIPPTFMDLLIVDSPPGVQGNTSGNVMRPATLETGAEVQIPLFIEQGTRIKVDTRTGEYVERSK